LAYILRAGASGVSLKERLWTNSWRAIEVYLEASGETQLEESEFVGIQKVKI